MSAFLAVLGVVVAGGAAWIGYRALMLSHQAQQDARHRQARAEAHDQLRWIELLLEQVRRLQDAQGAERPEEFRDIQMAMRAAVAIGGLRRRLPVTAILSERPFNVDAAGGKPGWESFLLTVDAVREELFGAADAISAHEKRKSEG